MRPSSILALAVALMIVVGPTGFAVAKKGGSFSSGGSRSGSSGWSSSSKPSTPAPSQSGSSSGWSGSKPSTTQPSAPAKSSQTAPGGFSNSSGAASGTASKAGGTSAFSSAGASTAQRQAATTSYKGYQGLYSKPGNPVGAGQVSTGKPILNQNRSFGSYKDYNGYRDNYYAGRGYAAPGYAFNSFSRFGMWDAMFMWFMLSNMTSGAGFFHNNQSDPGVKAFKEEAAKLSESNADLKKQLDEMNAKLEGMKNEGVPVDPSAFPKDVDPNIALADPKIDESMRDSEESSGGLFWPLAAAAALGGGALWMFNRRRA